MNKFDGYSDFEIDILFRGSYRPSMDNVGLVGLIYRGAERTKAILRAQAAYDEVETELQRRRKSREYH